MANPTNFVFFGIWGVATDVYFATQDVTDTDDLYIGTAFAAADAKISKDGGAVASTTGTPSQVTASQPIYKLTLTATEMQAGVVFVTIRDQTEPEVFEPITITVIVKLQVGQLTVDARALDDNAFQCMGGGANGSGIYADCETVGANSSGMRLASGAKINGEGLTILSSTKEAITATGASGFAGILGVAGGGNAPGIQGTGAGTGGGIKGVGGATGYGLEGQGNAGGGSATDRVTNIFNQVEGDGLSGAGQPTSVINDLATFGAILQNLKRRFTNKVTQTATAQTWYRDNSSTVLQTSVVSDDGTTQTKGKVA